MYKKILASDILSYLLVGIVFIGLATTIYGGYQVLERTRQLDSLSQSEPESLSQTDQERRDLDSQRAESMTTLGVGIAVIAVGWTAANALSRYRKSG